MKILLIGAIHQNHPPEGGEEFKNQLLVRFFRAHFSRCEVIDTKYWRTQPKVWIRLFVHLFLVSYDRIIISASSASTYRLLQIVYYLSRRKLSKIVYMVIGGYFPEAVTAKIYRRKFYADLFQIIVEGHYLKDELKKSALESNVSVIPNFKAIEATFIPAKVAGMKEEKTRFVFLSRIAPSKGVPEIFEAVALLRQRKNLPAFSVDFYGPVEAPFQSSFFSLIGEYADSCTYKGYLDLVGETEQSYQTLAEYHCMLFPTYWQGEGFPGVVVDAYIAGLPIIGSDWNMNSEIIEEGKTGYLIEPKSSEQLAAAMEKIILDPETLKILSKNSLQKAKAYDYRDVLTNHLLPLIKTEAL